MPAELGRGGLPGGLAAVAAFLTSGLTGDLTGSLGGAFLAEAGDADARVSLAAAGFPVASGFVGLLNSSGAAFLLGLLPPAGQRAYE